MGQPLTESKLRLLLLELEDRIRSGERLVAEKIFAEHPVLFDDDESSIEIIYREVLTLEQLGERPDNANLFARFPTLTKRLRKLLEVHDALADEELIDSPATEKPVASVGQTIDKYKLLQEIGEGGFGVVYMAEQVRPVRRKVALKVIKPGMDTRDALARFEAERQALALMDHPNIAHVLDAGATDSGHPFFVMELVRGVPITEYCKSENVSVSDRLKLFRSVCQAVQHAHSKGIIHRDLKPSNVMITLHDTIPVPKIIDFGISKALNQQLTEKTLFTRYGQMLGTPMYMSPEQAEMSGLGVDIRSDVYSLGVLLYELLTGTPPFSAQRLKTAAYAEMVRIISEEDPPTPSTRIETIGKTSGSLTEHRGSDYRLLSGEVRGDLDQIVMKALEKDRSRRYETVNDLSRDVERYMNDEPVSAGSPSLAYRSQKYLRRNRTLVRSAAAVFAALVLGLVVSLIGFVNAHRASERAESARIEEQRQRLRAENEERKLKQALINEQAHLERVDTNLYYQQIARIHREWMANKLDSANRILGECSEGRRGWEWRYLKRVVQPDVMQLKGHTDKVVAVAFSPDGKKLASCSSEWNNQSKLGEVILWDAETGDELLRLGPFRGGASMLRFSSSGERLVTATGNTNGKGVSVWNANTGRLEYTSDAGKRIYGVACSPDGKMIASAAAKGQIRLLDFDSGDLIRTMETGRSQFSLDFSPDGKQLASTSTRGITRLWDPTTGKLLFETTGLGGNRFVRFSPDGKQLATCGYDGSRHGLVKLYRVESNRLIESASHSSHFGVVSKVEFSPDSRLLALNGLNGKVRFWEPLTGRGHTSFPAHNGFVGHVQFGPDGRRAASCGDDGVVRIWDLVIQENSTYSRRGAFIRDFDQHPDGVKLALAGGYNQSAANAGEKSIEVLKYDPKRQTYELVNTFESPSQWINKVDYTQDGTKLLGAGNGGQLVIWDDSTGLISKTIDVKATALRTAQFGHNGDWLACDGNEFELDIFSVETGKLQQQLNGHAGAVNSVSCHPELPIVASASEDGTIKIWDVSTGEEIQTLEKHQTAVTHLSFNKDGTILASADASGVIFLWERNSKSSAFRLNETVALAGHHGRVTGMSFSADGERLASIGSDKTVAVWDVRNQQEAIRLSVRIANPHVFSVLFNANGSQILASCGRHIQVWDAHVRTPIERELPVPEDKLVAWHMGAYRLCIEDRNWFGSRFHMDRIVAMQPNESSHWSRLANAHAELGDYVNAIDAYQKAYELDKSRVAFLIHISLLQLTKKEIDRQSKTQKQILEFYPGDVPASRKNQLAWSASIAGGAAEDSERVLKLAEEAVSESPSAARLNTLALALYRTQQFAKSFSYAKEAMELRQPKIDATDWLFCSLSLAAIGDTEAIRWFDKSAWEIEERLAANAVTPVVSWTEKLELQILRDEAAEAIKKLIEKSGSQKLESSWLKLTVSERERMARLGNIASQREKEHDWLTASELLKTLVEIRPLDAELAARLSYTQGKLVE